MLRTNSQLVTRNSQLAATVLLAAVLAVSCAFAQDAKPKKGDWPMWGGTPDRNFVSDETGIPASWDVKTGRNIKWVAPLGSQSYGNPSIANGRILVGCNNGGVYRAKAQGDKGIVLCFDMETGKLLWQATHDKLPTGQVNDWPEQGICSSPAIDGDRAYYVSNRCEVVCVDLAGLRQGRNTGPYTSEKYNEPGDADFVWIFDMIDELGVFPHNLATSSPLIVGDYLYVVTSNGVDEGHLNIPSPDAPAFICLEKKTGKLVWHKNYPGKNLLHGQWSSPSYAVVKGKPEVFFPGGDGWLYALDPKDGALIWKYDMNPKDAVWKLGGRGTRNNIIATPVFRDDHVFLAVGQDPEHGEGIGHFHCIDATKTGDVTESGKAWTVDGDDFHRTISSASVAGGLVYACDLSGFAYCFDEKTGQRQWRYDTMAALWGSPYAVDGKVFLGDEDGVVHVLKQGRELKEIGTIQMEASVYSTPVASHGMLFVATKRSLYCIKDGAQLQKKE